MRPIRLALATLLAAALFAGAAQAACKLGSKTYPEGTTYSKFVCKGGKWVKR